jgi:hypothetical protein
MAFTQPVSQVFTTGYPANIDTNLAGGFRYFLKPSFSVVALQVFER